MPSKNTCKGKGNWLKANQLIIRGGDGNADVGQHRFKLIRKYKKI
jgi:hypothetical protein